MNHPTTSAIGPDLLQAYGETYYCVNDGESGQGGFVLRIGEVSKQLAQTHQKYEVDCSAFMTACNPWSEALPETENTERQDKLKQILRLRSLSWIEGIGQHPSNQWPAEPSVLVLGLSLAAAKVLAMEFEQNAFVWSGADATPRLVLLR
jgi:hypothetical protein